MHPLVESHREEIVQRCRRYGVRRLELFGSILRADFDVSGSDVDVVVEFDPQLSGKGLREYFDMKAELEALFRRPVDLVELGAMEDTRLKRIILETAVGDRSPTRPQRGTARAVADRLAGLAAHHSGEGARSMRTRTLIDWTGQSRDQLPFLGSSSGPSWHFMQRRPGDYLELALLALRKLPGFLGQHSLQDSLAGDYCQSAVERQLEIAGDAPRWITRGSIKPALPSQRS